MEKIQLFNSLYDIIEHNDVDLKVFRGTAAAMTGKQVVFYSVVDNFQEVSVKLCEKLYNTCRILFLCRDDKSVKETDSKLWTFSKLSFLPHGSRLSVPISDATYCRIWVSTRIDERANNPDCLLHNGFTIAADDLSCFSNVIDIFPRGAEEEALKRAKVYKSAMFNDQKIWAQVAHGWQKSESLLC
jgi:DNA polymerase IIIc chi subunit